MELLVIGGSIFVATVIIIELTTYAFKNMHSAKRAKIRRRLRNYTYVESNDLDSEIIKKRVLSDIPLLNRLLLHTPGLSFIDKLVIQSNAKQPLGVFLLSAATLAAAAYLGLNILTHNSAYAIIGMLVAGASPFLYLLNLKQKRMNKFKQQLPDALDLIARALKAGHAFTGSLSMAAEEFDDPIGTEFSEVLDEINFGISVSDALTNMLNRVDCEELKYFVVGVILQRETGGNLAELMETLAQLIRERFKFAGKVKTLSAEGKFSAVVLILLPILLFAYLWIANPKFLSPLLTQSTGRIMIVAALVGMVVGAFVMKRMVEIKV